MSLRLETLRKHHQRDIEIESRVRDLQVELWRNRTKFGTSIRRLVLWRLSIPEWLYRFSGSKLSWTIPLAR